MGRLLAVGLIVIAALAAVFVVNGEGPNKPEEKEAESSGQQSSTVATAAPKQQPETSGEPGSHGAPIGATVIMKNLHFRPGAVSVEVGQSVRFVNEDNVAHTVLEDFGPRSGTSPAVDSRRIQPGETFSFVVRSKRLISYVCTLHPTVMVGQVMVDKRAD
ncbi:MAG: plastocyanin/azurin family copper-binding protein [Solirubrobacteraceae bacterium]